MRSTFPAAGPELTSKERQYRNEDFIFKVKIVNVASRWNFYNDTVNSTYDLMLPLHEHILSSCWGWLESDLMTIQEGLKDGYLLPRQSDVSHSFSEQQTTICLCRTSSILLHIHNASFTQADFYYASFLLRRKFTSVNGHFLTHFPRGDVCAGKLTGRFTVYGFWDLIVETWSQYGHENNASDGDDE